MAKKHRKGSKQGVGSSRGFGKKELQRSVISVFNRKVNKPLNYKQISSAIGRKDYGTQQSIIAILAQMAAQGELEEISPGRFKLIRTAQKLTGVAQVISSGAAFVVIEGRDDDIYIPKKFVNRVLPGDIVAVKIFDKSRGKRTEGEIIEVIERRKDTFVGRIELVKEYGFLVANDQKMPVDLFIPKDKLKGAKHGQIAIARITDWPKDADSPFAEITEVLGDPGDNDTEMYSILMEYGFPLGFPDKVLKDAENISTVITKEEIAKRRDLRKVTTFTIDPKDAKDFDDALSIQQLKNGNWEIGVHIADVSHYLVEGSDLDKEAVERATSVYLVDRVIPMLPEVLSNNLCSLRPNEEKLCFSVIFELNDAGTVLDKWFGKTVIYSDRRFIYEEVQDIIETGEGDFKDEILTLDKIAKRLREKRIKQGSILFDKVEVRFNIGEDGKPDGVYFKVQKDANKLIEDFMLLANRSVAEYISKGKEKPKTYVYRIHDNPNPEKLLAFNNFIGKFGHQIKVGSPQAISQSLNKLLTDVVGQPEENVVSTLAIRTMAKAEYSTDNRGHYGLSFDYYSHFTSPIRRYPDVIAHRLLFDYLNGGKSANEERIEELCKHCSDMERVATQAERDSIKYFQVKMLEDKIGEEFEGVISGVSEWGAYVEIVENKCEGMVRLKSIIGDNYYFDEENYQIVGHNEGRKFQLGDSVRIKVMRADLARKQIDFEFVLDDLD